MPVISRAITTKVVKGKTPCATARKSGDHNSSRKQLQLRLDSTMRLFSYWSQNSAVGIVTCYGLVTKGSEFESWQDQQFSLLHCVLTSPASYSMGIRAPSSRAKWPECEDDHSRPPTCAEINKTWIYTSTLPYIFMDQCWISSPMG
jgi:hypothetical protein